MCKHGTHIHVQVNTHRFKSTHTHISTYTEAHTYSQTHQYTLIYTDVCTDVTDRYTHVHTLTQIHGKTGYRQILNTHTCAHRHSDTQTPAHTQTRVCANVHGHTSITDTRDALWRGVAIPVSTQTAPCAWAQRGTLAGACPLLPARSSAPALSRTPAPTHSSLRGLWPEAGPGPGSGGWARGGSGWRQHQEGERKRLGDLGHQGRLCPAQGCPGTRPGMRN